MFFKERLTVENYTWGMNYVGTQNFESFILSQFPELESGGGCLPILFLIILVEQQRMSNWALDKEQVAIVSFETHFACHLINDALDHGSVEDKSIFHRIFFLSSCSSERGVSMISIMWNAIMKSSFKKSYLLFVYCTCTTIGNRKKYCSHPVSFAMQFR